MPLVDIGLVVRDEVEGQDVFSPVTLNGQTPLQKLVEGFPTIWDLESSIEQGEHCITVADAIYSGYRRPSGPEDFAAVTRTIAESYRILSINGVVLHPTDAIADLCYARMLSEDGLLVAKRNIDDNLSALQVEYPNEVRFHVDRLGRPAYVIIADELIDELRAA